MTYHLWTSKLAGTFLVVCVLGPWAPQLVGWAFGVLCTMYVFQIFSMLRLRKKDKQKGLDGAVVVAYVFFVCIACGLVSIAYMAYRDFGGGTNGVVRASVFVAVALALSYSLEWCGTALCMLVRKGCGGE